jgi:hypothetical protein
MMKDPRAEDSQYHQPVATASENETIRALMRRLELEILRCDTAEARLKVAKATAYDLLLALKECENALADYIPAIEQRKGSSLYYGHRVLALAREVIAKCEGR